MHTIDITAANSKAVFDFNEMGGPCFGPVHHINYQIREAGEYNNELDSLSNLNIDIPFGTTCAVELNNLSPENVTVTL